MPTGTMLVLAAAAAQVAAPAAVQAPAPAPVPAPPVLVAPPAPPPMEERLAVAALADHPLFGWVDLLKRPGDRLFVAFRDPEGRPVGDYELNLPIRTLSILADRRLEPLWAPLLAHAGPGLERQRDRVLEQTRRAYTYRVASSAPDGTYQDQQATFYVLSALQRIDALAGAGRMQEAMAEMVPEIARYRARKTIEDAYSEFQIRVALAKELHQRDRTNEALALLSEGETNPALPKDYRVNYMINRAALLVESGRHKEALAVHRKLTDTFEDVADDGDANPIGPVGLQFAWIEACALSGLGRKKAAAVALAPVAAAGPQHATIRLRAVLCMADEQAVADELVEQLTGSQVPASAAVFLQPGYRAMGRSRLLFDRAMARPEVKAAFDRRYRLLPPELQPALSRWEKP